MNGVTVVVPTFNESGNVAELVRRLEHVALHSPIDELVFVDDSTDHTPDVISEVGAASSLRVRLVHREPHERDGGLSGAVVRGIEESHSPWVVVMDGDLQHPPEDVPLLIGATPGADVVVASRYRPGGDAGGLANRARRWVSSACTRLASIVFPKRLKACTDPMTGFFAVRRAAIDVPSLRPRGFKILLEVLARHPLRVVEVPFCFGERYAGTSKASLRQGWRFGSQLARLRWDTWWSGPPTRAGRVLRFGAVGLANVLLDVLIFNLLVSVTVAPVLAKLASSGSATVSSYVMNRAWTWADRQGVAATGLPLFLGLSAFGVALSETSLVISHYTLGLTTALDDNLSANVVGLLLSSAWRYWSYAHWVFPATPPVLDLDSTSTVTGSAMTTPGWETELSPPVV